MFHSLIHAEIDYDNFVIAREWMNEWINKQTLPPAVIFSVINMVSNQIDEVKIWETHEKFHAISPPLEAKNTSHHYSTIIYNQKIIMNQILQETSLGFMFTVLDIIDTVNNIYVNI